MSGQKKNKEHQNTPLGDGGMELNKYSKTLTQDPTQPAAQAMFYGIGFKEEDFEKAQVALRAWVGMAIPVTCI